MKKLLALLPLSLLVIGVSDCKKPVKPEPTVDTEKPAKPSPKASAKTDDDHDKDEHKGPKNEGKAGDQDDDKSPEAEKGCKLPEAIKTDVTIAGTCTVKVSADVRVQEGASLTIEPGAKLLFKPDTRMIVDHGKIVANGTEDKPIVFTSANKTPSVGDWVGFVFESQTTAGNSFDHVVVEYAGKEYYGMAAFRVAGEVGPKRISITNSKIRKSYSALINHDSPMAKFEGNTLSDNEKGAIDVRAKVFATIGTNKFGNPIHVFGDVNESATWPTVDQPIVFSGALNIYGETSGAILTIPKGTEIQFDAEGLVVIGDNASGGLVADGVKFTSANATKAEADWAGLRVGTKVTGTKITNCTIEYAGKDHYGSGAILWTDASRMKGEKNVKIEHTTFAHNTGGAFVAPGKDCGPFAAPAAGNKSEGSPLCAASE